MAGSRKAVSTGIDPWEPSPRNGGPLGSNRDAGDPETPASFLGDTEGSLGHGDHGDPDNVMRRGETEPLVVKPEVNFSVEFEGKDLSVGAAKYTGTKPVSKNLTMQPNPGGQDIPMIHANVEIHLYDDRRREVHMTRRLVRYWWLQPQPGATVEDESKWRLTKPDKNFRWDRPGSTDAPGWFPVPESIGEPFGTLQEFLVGNKWVGGVYFQVYTLGDNEKIRVIESEPVPLSKTDYSELLRLIDTKAFPKVFGDRRVFSPKGNTTDNTTPLPKPKHKRVR